MKDGISIAMNLIQIPSYVSDDCNENAAMDWIEQWCVENVPDMNVTSYPLADGRRNLYIGNTTPTVLYVGHIDTVCPTDGWDTDPLKPIVKDGVLYGLGAADMKGSVAALFAALVTMSATVRAKVGVLLYVDEEYRFAGMKQMISDKIITTSNQPEIVISLDGNPEVLTGCRGLIKVDMEILGKSGHASNPANGVNVITELTRILAALNRSLERYSSEQLGNTTLNVAYLRAGAVSDTTKPEAMQRTGNVIPNYADCVIELRVASEKLTAQVVQEFIEAECRRRGLSVQSYKTKIELMPWRGSASDRKALERLRACYTDADIDWQLDDPRYRGYIDVQMLAETIASPTYVLGAGGSNRHGANESVPVENLEKIAIVCTRIAERYIRRRI